jgi:hypothetical protein
MKRNLASMLALAVFVGLAASAAAQDSEEPEELVGYITELEDGTFFNLFVENNNLTIHIWDKEKKEKQEIPWNRARIQYQPPSNQRQSTFMTRSDDGTTLSSPHVVRRPIAFNFWLYLFKEGSDDATTMSGRVVQPMEGDGASVSLYDLLEAGKDPNG